jgi:putative acetyltransferase
LVTIRPETASDAEAVFRVELEAFGEEMEPRLVEALRAAGRVLLSLVAEEDGRIVGHVLFTAMSIESDEASFPAVCLGPLAVLPEYQRRGIGGRLLEEGLRQLRQAGHSAVFLLGHPSYYPRFGFRPAREFGVSYQDSRDAFQAIELRPGALAGVSGRAVFAPEFEAADS